MIRRAIAATCWLASARAAGWSFVSAQGRKPPGFCEAIRNAAATAGGLMKKLVPRGFRLPKVFQKPPSICRWCGLLTACHKLVRVGCPGNREQRQERNNGQRSHARYGCIRLWLKTSEFDAFCGQTGETSWQPAMRLSHSPRCQPALIGNRPIRRLPRRNRQTQPENPSTSADRPASAVPSRRS
jgi:hypothetical protein